MKDWDWSTTVTFIFVTVLFSALWFCVGYLYGGLDMARSIEAHP